MLVKAGKQISEETITGLCKNQKFARNAIQDIFLLFDEINPGIFSFFIDSLSGLGGRI